MTRSNITITLVFAIFILLEPACERPTETPPANIANLFEIHLQSAFYHTPARVFIDNSQVFADTVSTSPLLGIAARIPAQVGKGTHIITVNVFNSIAKDTTFTIVDTLFICVNYNTSTSQLTYYFTRRRPLYD